MQILISSILAFQFCRSVQGWQTASVASRSSPQLIAIDQADVASRIGSTDRGRSVSDSEREELERYFSTLEAKCTLSEPARSPFVEGTWEVEYTTAPPPSNGQLGPFSGIAYQEVDLQSGRYANILKVPPNDWLSATLEATWEEWDGQLLEDATKGKGWKEAISEIKKEEDPIKPLETNPLTGFFRSRKTNKIDYGATCWVVTFETLTVKLFGIPVVTQKFDNTKRVWRTTYVDDKTRIVRAGRTGKREDEILFYMTRQT